MTLTEALTTLRLYNAWRRYDGPIDKAPAMPDPKAISEAINIAIHVLENLK